MVLIENTQQQFANLGEQEIDQVIQPLLPEESTAGFRPPRQPRRVVKFVMCRNDVFPQG